MNNVLVKPKAQQVRSIKRVNRLKEALVEVMGTVSPMDFNSNMVPSVAGINRTSMYRYYRTLGMLAVEVFDDRIGDLLDAIESDDSLEDAIYRIRDIFCDISMSMLQTVEMADCPLGGIDKIAIELRRRYPRCDFVDMRRIVKACILIDAEAGIALLEKAR